MALYLHLYFGLKAAFEFNGKAILEYGDPLDQPADHPFVVICITALCFQIFQFCSVAMISRCQASYWSCVTEPFASPASI